MIDALLIGLATFYTINLARRLPKIEGLVLAEVRPWSCDTCMSFWFVLPWTIALHLAGRVPFDLLISVAAMGVSLGLFQVIDARPGIPLPPPLEEENE